MPVQNLNTYGNANPKYCGRNWSNRRLPVRNVNSIASSLSGPWHRAAVACKAETCCAFTSAMPTLVRSPTTAFGFAMLFISSAKSSAHISWRTGVAAFCRIMQLRSSSYGNMATTSSGTPSSGNALASLYICSISMPWKAGCPRATASSIRRTTTALRTRAWCTMRPTSTLSCR